jgi:hypothetical protein
MGQAERCYLFSTLINYSIALYCADAGVLIYGRLAYLSHEICTLTMFAKGEWRHDQAKHVNAGRASFDVGYASLDVTPPATLP